MSPSRFIPAESPRAKRLARFPYPALALLPGRAAPPDAPAEPSLAAATATEAPSAYDAGFLQGEAQGLAQAEAQHRAALARVDLALTDLSAVATRLGQALDQEVLALTLAVGEHLALQQLAHTPEGLQTLLRATLEALPFPLPRGRREGDQPLQVFLHPADLALLSEAPKPGVALVADPALSRGGLRVEAPSGVFDASLERRRHLLMRALEGP